MSKLHKTCARSRSLLQKLKSAEELTNSLIQFKQEEALSHLVMTWWVFWQSPRFQCITYLCLSYHTENNHTGSLKVKITELKPAKQPLSQYTIRSFANGTVILCMYHLTHKTSSTGRVSCTTTIRCDNTVIKLLILFIYI